MKPTYSVGFGLLKLFIVIQIQSTITMYCLEKIDPFNIKQLSRYKNNKNNVMARLHI